MTTTTSLFHNFFSNNCFFGSFNIFSSCIGHEDDDEDDAISVTSFSSSSSSSIIVIDDNDDAALILFANDVNALCLCDVTLLDEFAAATTNDNDKYGCSKDDFDDSSSYITTVSDATEGIAKLQQELENVQVVPSHLFFDEDNITTTGSWDDLEDHDGDHEDVEFAVTSTFSSNTNVVGDDDDDDDALFLLFTKEVNSLCKCDLGLLEEFRQEDSSDDSSCYTIMSDATEGIAILQQDLANVQFTPYDPPANPIQTKIPNTAASLDGSCVATVPTVTTASSSSVVSWELSSVTFSDDSSSYDSSNHDDNDTTNVWEFLNDDDLMCSDATNSNIQHKQDCDNNQNKQRRRKQRWSKLLRKGLAFTLSGLARSCHPLHPIFI